MFADSDSESRKTMVIIIVIVLVIFTLLIIGSLSYEFEKIISPSSTGDKNWDGN